MEKHEIDNYLETRFEPQSNWYDKNSNLNRKIYQWLQWSMIVLSATIPVLVVKLEGECIYITAVLSILLAICTTALKAFKYQEKWINYRSTHEALKREFEYYSAGVAHYEQARDKDKTFIFNAETLMLDENSKWIEILRKKEQEKDSGI